MPARVIPVYKAAKPIDGKGGGGDPMAELFPAKAPDDRVLGAGACGALLC